MVCLFYIRAWCLGVSVEGDVHSTLSAIFDMAV